MVGILLVTHNTLGASLADCVAHVLGAVPKNLKVLSVLAKDDPQHKLAEGEELIKELDNGSGVLILADVFGATPSNIGRQLCHAERVEGVAGVNLPMLLRVICSSGQTLSELANLAVEGGRDCIVHMEH
ncbi:MAG: PTS fructose transporter subunit IIA [Gallionellales bacterium CG_4_10_14_3_um_filter_54_96]|nr:PTS fructose transporter subunit IIA [Gallionella sp.]OIO74682.1 MAG: PTS fructose transporter subunit IIA [Gallionellaceae bacterium CG1_02_56_997]PIV14530.1 MAG: PTS fructose transporter subunit IIA [Gallionellales bacterium CG03_land_8_20_14_0_80_55_15]PIV91987.1 MAG: PTS fructose transporter subunit IIA [Gallionellales bacterium CG17_big_fil_post_rev_8_21_14_2_50_54_146]PIX05063.1 MAG: PTS fructose transporter subunit IIA [Gallionellales bacterium CG_4_8_14_3_um_filter_54_18]PIY06923.1 